MSTRSLHQRRVPIACLLIGVMLAGVIPATSCRPAPQIIEVTRVVAIRTVTEAGEPVEATRLVSSTSEFEATPSISFIDPHPDAFIKLAAADVQTLDPALAYDPGSAEALQNVVEGLFALDIRDSNRFVPALAEAVPSTDNGLISADGLTYTFPIRRGVSFHDGGTLDPHDVAYSIRRQLLQSDPTGPAWLFLEPILGVTDVTEEIAGGAYIGDPDGLRGGATAEELAAACAAVIDAVAYDDKAGTVTITLAQPWGPFLPTLSWLGVIDQEWAIAHESWDGACDNWAEYYAPGLEGSELTAVVNGTGPYRLERWTPGEEFVLSAFEGYWRAEDTPLWEDGPWGMARIPKIIVHLAPEWGSRLAGLVAGDADTIDVPFDNEAQVDPLAGEWCDYLTGECRPNPDNPDGPLRKWDGLPTVQRIDIFMNQFVAPDSPYLGSGALDANGIPTDFFADEDIRRAMAVCFDYDTYNADVLGGEGVRNNGPIIAGLPGYNPDGPMYDYDPEACAAHLAQAWDGVLPETGFRLQFVYPTTIPGGVQVGAVLQAGLAAVNEKYVVELVGLTSSSFFPGLFSGRFPIFYSGWIEDVHDPHNWAAPYTVGLYGSAMNLPDDLTAEFGRLVSAGVTATDPATREAAYFELQRLFHDAVPAVILFQRPSFRFEPRYVDGFAYREGMPADSPLFYTLSTTP